MGPIKTTVPLKWGYMGFHVSLGECNVADKEKVRANRAWSLLLLTVWTLERHLLLASSKAEFSPTRTYTHGCSGPGFFGTDMC